jgi:hypothetical protein
MNPLSENWDCVIHLSLPKKTTPTLDRPVTEKWEDEGGTIFTYVIQTPSMYCEMNDLPTEWITCSDPLPAEEAHAKLAYTRRLNPHRTYRLIPTIWKDGISHDNT